MKRSGRHDSASEEDLEETSNWEAFLGEETLNQLQKASHGGLATALLQEEPFARSLLSSWHYQYVISWLYKVADSYVTVNWVEGFKPMWRNIKFDEFLLLEDLRTVDKLGLLGEHDEGSLYRAIRLQLLKQMTNHKANKLQDWDAVLNHQLGTNTNFHELSVFDQLETIYRVIKIIESKSLVFKNYLSSNLDLFQFAEYTLDENRSLLVLPNVGVVVEKTLARPEEISLHVPVKLENCTVKYWDEKTQVVELIHLDYSNAIQDYLESFKVQYNVLTKGWNEFLEWYAREPNMIDFDEWIPIYAEHQLHVNRLIAHREKERSMAELLVTRKRSSRLVAREEETRRRDLENKWYEKLDDRDFFLRTRAKVVAKQLKRIKDSLWSQVWQNFETDLKELKEQKRHELGEPEQPARDDELTKLDLQVIQDGPRFTKRIIPSPAARAKITTPTEMPSELCVDQQELDELESFGIAINGEHPDDRSWVFHCPNEPEIPPLVITNIDEEEAASQTHDNLLSKPIIRCDMCLQWQHWDCAQQDLAYQPAHRDYAIVQLGNYAASRRSSRKQPQEQVYTPPVDKVPPIADSPAFICRYCASDAETQLRSQFAQELQASRLNAKRQQEELERKRLLKEHKKQQQQLELETPSHELHMPFT